MFIVVEEKKVIFFESLFLLYMESDRDLYFYNLNLIFIVMFMLL